MVATIRNLALALLIALTLAAAGCSADATPIEDDAPAKTGALALRVGDLPNSLSPLSTAFSKHIDVWGVNIVATSATEDDKIMHAANVLAQYLDNDADGVPDNPAVVEAMVANRATLLMAQDPDEFESIDADAVFSFVGSGGQDLYGSETRPDGGFDASLEEVHHLILNTGWSQIFPDQLAQAEGSEVAMAMDTARGGHFDTIPSEYPSGAWYTYDDRTCDYTCMVTEYTYWAHTSLLGAQADREAEIADEWRLATADALRQGDPAVTALLEDPALGLPTVLPDGDYRPEASG